MHSSRTSNWRLSRSRRRVAGAALACLASVAGLVLGRAAPADSPPAGTADAASHSLARAFTVLPGFRIDGVYRVPTNQGSWVCLTVDPQGRLITSDQFGKLYRLSLPTTNQPPKVETLDLEIGSAQGLLHALNSLYVVVNRKRETPNQPGSGLYRVRDTNRDDRFDKVELLREIDGDGEHGPHAVVLGPDGRSLFLVGGNATALPNPEQSLVPRNWQEDTLVPRLGQTDGLFLKQRPGGWIARTDADGRVFELVAIGLRNPYDLAFNVEGQLFTFDSDMEWDMGTPWYRPTRVLHVTSGADFGWRTGSNKWPDYYLDSLPPVLDVGPSSPTGLAFGFRARFPARFQRALFLADWSYGKIYTLQLEPRGASYVGKIETFLSGAPMAITDLLIHPREGALYFIVGGRGTSSALYRVSYQGSESTAPVAVSNPSAAGARAERRRLESFHGRLDPEAVPVAWPYLDHLDPHLRHAARIAIENQPVETWLTAALTEPRARARIAALTALARCGGAATQPMIVDSLAQIPWGTLSLADQIDFLRAYTLVFTRGGRPTEAVRARALAQLNALYPAPRFELNRELCALLVFLRASGVVPRTLKLLETVAAQEDQLYYAVCLRTLDAELWTDDEHQRFFDWLNRTAADRGGVSFAEYLRQVRADVVERLSPVARATLGDRIIEKPPVDPYAALKARPRVKEWTVDELLPAVESERAGRDLERGRQLYGEAMCRRCHRLNRAGGMTGPDLTGVGARFDSRALLESILQPSRVVSDQYSTVAITTRGGDSYTGRIADLNDEGLLLLVDLVNPAAFKRIPHRDIADILPGKVSLMPTGLLDHYTQEEILDLIAYLRAGSAAKFQ